MELSELVAASPRKNPSDFSENYSNPSLLQLIMDKQVPLPASPFFSVLSSGPRCRLCRSNFRRRSPGQKYCDRCRKRRSGGKSIENHFPAAVEVSLPRQELTYRVHTPVLAILSLDGERVPVTIPANSCIHINELPSDFSGNMLIDVLWNGKSLLMFVRDIQSRAEALRPADLRTNRPT